MLHKTCTRGTLILTSSIHPRTFDAQQDKCVIDTAKFQLTRQDIGVSIFLPDPYPGALRLLGVVHGDLPELLVQSVLPTNAQFSLQRLAAKWEGSLPQGHPVGNYIWLFAGLGSRRQIGRRCERLLVVPRHHGGGYHLSLVEVGRVVGECGVAVLRLFGEQ